MGALHRCANSNFVHDARVNHQHVGQLHADGSTGPDLVRGALAAAVVARRRITGDGQRGDWEEAGGWRW